jgi:hypothetical protein
MIQIALMAGMLAVGASAGHDKGTKAETPFFCNVKALTRVERAEHQQLSSRLAGSILRTVEIAEGYEFQVDSRRVSMKDLAIWAEFERRCCPFFDFILEWRRENGPVTLRLTGREGVKQFIRAEMRIVPR